MLLSSLAPSSGSNGGGIFNMKIDTFDHKALMGPPKIPGLHPDSIQIVPSSTENSKKSNKKKKKSNSNSNSAVKQNDFESSMNHISHEMVMNVENSTTVDPAKKLRNLRKKLRDIETLEKKLADGDLKNPEPEQLEKLARKIVMLKEISDLEGALAKMST